MLFYNMICFIVTSPHAWLFIELISHDHVLVVVGKEAEIGRIHRENLWIKNTKRKLLKYIWRDGQTDRQTDGQTDRPADNEF
jgi:hypothetical protein